MMDGARRGEMPPDDGNGGVVESRGGRGSRPVGVLSCVAAKLAKKFFVR